MTNNPAIKRIMRELKEIQENNDPLFHAEYLSDNIFEWHFTLRGPLDSCYKGGLYHGRIILPPEYPFKPPHIIMLTVRNILYLDTSLMAVSKLTPRYA
jgi:ubiquitin-conjugating enzyme E2 J1